jgi:hypothetical protein
VERQALEEVTGQFDIFVGNKLVHSKLNGDGWLDTQQKLNRLASAVRDSSTESSAAGNDQTTISVSATLVKQDNPEEEEEEEGNASLIVSLLTLVLSIPALIGA